MDTPYLIQNRVSRIEHLALYGSNVKANDIFTFDSGLAGLGVYDFPVGFFNLIPSRGGRGHKFLLLKTVI